MCMYVFIEWICSLDRCEILELESNGLKNRGTQEVGNSGRLEGSKYLLLKKSLKQSMINARLSAFDLVTPVSGQCRVSLTVLF